MKVYRVRVARTEEIDIDRLADFLFKTLSKTGSYRYLDVVGQEMSSLSVYADCFSESRSRTIQNIHPHARRMVSHNHKLVYIFHIEGGLVIIDRVLFAKMIID